MYGNADGFYRTFYQNSTGSDNYDFYDDESDTDLISKHVFQNIIVYSEETTGHKLDVYELSIFVDAMSYMKYFKFANYRASLSVYLNDTKCASEKKDIIFDDHASCLRIRCNNIDGLPMKFDIHPEVFIQVIVTNRLIPDDKILKCYISKFIYDEKINDYKREY